MVRVHCEKTGRGEKCKDDDMKKSNAENERQTNVSSGTRYKLPRTRNNDTVKKHEEGRSTKKQIWADVKGF
jgi:hypothetical protein